MGISLFVLIILLSYTTIYSQEATDIFNGKDLSGRTKPGSEFWYVDGGKLVCENGPEAKYGYLSTKRIYKNFILNLDYKLEKNSKSGIFIRPHAGSNNGTSKRGWQIEVTPPKQHIEGIYRSTVAGKDFLTKPYPEDEKHLKPTAWNHMRTETNGNTVNN
ncbi:3-keto-disaccharide hydrolase [Maribacter ulvicola]|uniref:3-keto-alpha-glucoside-1,2-lyase/3-keto-2-hydroxy-glucal hydratase domain-containing protein n=1 Tax=Maribacter ulvicola TaxID=228959 RepID=A0A1N6RQ21_9FLAO|nr:DUF1080 domain-containing protein [Maribacter ulvicola]SIQ30978.1 protein of unknown function [Maribacter ulvicola]